MDKWGGYMIINTGQRTDIPAFYSDWFYNRIKEGYVCARNPYNPQRITKYKLDPQVVDCLCFCTKNPQPMLTRLDLIKNFNQFWFVTITPYDKDVEPYVPPVQNVILSFRELSKKVGVKCIGWRYDPIFINEKYTVERHIHDFEKMAEQLSGYTTRCIISFVDLYKKTIRNFPNVQEVSKHDRHIIAKAFSQIARKHHMKLYMCAEENEYEVYGIDCLGCMRKEVIEEAIGEELLIKPQSLREGCQCLIGNDIGEYHTCMHGCLYCYANESMALVKKRYQLHDPLSPLLIGHIHEEDKVYYAKQSSNINYQLSLF